MKDNSQQGFIAYFTIVFLLLPAIALAMGGTVQYPDGSPAVAAEVSIFGGGGGKTTVICDAQGRFELTSAPPAEAFVRIKAEGKDYAQVKLPASLFESGDVAIVLPAKQSGKSKQGGK